MGTQSQLDIFIEKALQFKLKLAETKSFNEIHKLWLETSIPYQMDNLLPYSEKYMDAQLGIYNKLTGENYNISKELTSTKQTDSEQFELGWPWSTKNLEVIGSQLGKTAQALVAIGGIKFNKEVLEIIELGSGWGNLAIPLAKAGHRVTCVDIDDGFLERLKRYAKRENCEISAIKGDFVETAECVAPSSFDCAIFQSSFHHCLNFDRLLSTIKKNVLTKQGVICFFAEPIFKNYAFPWGLRFDGESLWAIMCNAWLELGFDYDFFSKLLLKNGFFLTPVPGMGTLVGDGYIAVQCENGINLQDWAMPSSCKDTWHIHNEQGVASFSKHYSILPGLDETDLVNKRYKLEIRNFAPHTLNIKVSAGKRYQILSLLPGLSQTLEILANCQIVSFEVPTYIPDKLIGNGDTRELGFSVSSIYAD